MRGEKYAKKTPKMRFFHKYTGVIVLSIILVTIGLVWGYNETTKVFFEGWSCEQINGMDHTILFGDEHTRYHEIFEECKLEQFTP